MYQLSYFDVLKAWLSPQIDVGLLVIFIVIPLITMAMIACLIRKSLTIRHYLYGIGLILGVPLLIVLTTSFTFVESGWVLNNDSLELKAVPLTISINIEQSKVLMVNQDDGWQPRRRTNGVALPGLSMGWHEVGNGQEVVVFRHLTSSNTLLVESDKNYYLIKHPDVEKLYYTLLSRGAKAIPD